MKVPIIPLAERKTTFKEVETGFTKEQAITEAMRCIQCPVPNCVKGCPAEVNIPSFIKIFREGDTKKAADIIREKNFFPSICGRICQHEKQCEGNCILNKTKEGAVCIGGIERYIGDNTPYPERRNLAGKHIAIIGSGPSGLSAAAYLSQIGMHVTVLEGTNTFGGVIKYGVPEFRLPKDVVARELSGLQDLGIDFEPNSKIGEESLEQVSKRYDAVFIGTGVGKARILDIPGSGLKGVMSAMKFLVNLNQSGLQMVAPNEKLAVIGAGYVGMDAARSAIRLGGNVTCITTETEEQLKQRISLKDFEEAKEEDVKFIFGVKVKEFLGTEKVEKLIYENHVRGEIDCDKVVCAIGQEHDEDSLKAPLRTGKDGCIEVNEMNQTKIPNVFAAGDCVHGPKTVIQAIDSGRKTAESIIKYLDGKMASEALGMKHIDESQQVKKIADESNKDI
ncbi:MAG: FAD-dependent oxidoreductase [Candidatus Diapherotrites archaeon]|nr:FAD-dependent oxidoreductase [Candidatus Diapherotrites archaeon]